MTILDIGKRLKIVYNNMFFHKKQFVVREDTPLVKHNGLFRRQLSLYEGVALIVGATVGAGILGIPYVVAKVGLWVGLAYIISMGLVVMGSNLLIGEIVARTREKYQLIGLVRKYLGKWPGLFMSFLIYVGTFGVLLVYIIGCGESLSALFGGEPFMWSIGFFTLMTFVIWLGLRGARTVDFILSLGILAIVLIIAFMSHPHIVSQNFMYHNLAYLLLPYGVILAAFSGSSSIPEVHAVLKDRDQSFKKAIVLAGIINIVVYVLFAVVVVGVTGLETTQIATIGLGEKLGSWAIVFGNVFAVLAMATSFIVLGLSLKDSFKWDYKLNNHLSTILVCGIPLIIFLFGLRQFIQALDIVGGVFRSLEMTMLVLVYWYAKQSGILKESKFKMHHTLFLIAFILIAFTVGAIYSVVKLF